LAEEQKKEVKLDEDGNPILTDEELAAQKAEKEMSEE
jgi:hypothetical protein